jgi:hypothetical protein
MKVSPEFLSQNTGSVPSTISVAVGATKVTITPVGAVASTPEISEGAVMTGGVVSTTVTVNHVEALFE